MNNTKELRAAQQSDKFRLATIPISCVKYSFWDENQETSKLSLI